MPNLIVLIEKREQEAEAATEGLTVYPSVEDGCYKIIADCIVICEFEKREDAEFHAHSRTTVLALCKALKVLARAFQETDKVATYDSLSQLKKVALSDALSIIKGDE